MEEEASRLQSDDDPNTGDSLGIIDESVFLLEKSIKTQPLYPKDGISYLFEGKSKLTLQLVSVFV